ncbi:MAG: hypothetical protein ACW987_18515 [Candidatus Thorarchaeota archaeon]|jgi:hypothetical protein
MAKTLKWPDEATLNQTDIEKFLAIHGKKGIKTLSILGQRQKFAAAMKTEVGQMVLKSIMVKMEVLLDKMHKRIREYKDPQIEMISYNALCDLFIELVERITKFNDVKKKIKNL